MKQKKYLIFLLVILLVAGFFRFWQLEQLPPGLYPDVAINGTDALNTLKTGDFKIFYPENNGREGAFINLIALSFWLFGPSVWAIKIVPAVIGFLTVAGFYFLIKELFTYLAREKAESIALLSTFFLAVSFWHVNFSRLGFRAIMVPFCLVWSFWFLFRAINLIRTLNQVSSEAQSWSGWLRAKNSPALSFSLAGIFFGLGFHTYIAFRIAPIILVPLLIVEVVRYWPRFKTLWQEKKSAWEFSKQTYLKDDWWRWDVFFFAVILVALPIALYFWQHPADFMGRTGQVSVFASDNPVKTLVQTTAKTLGQFAVWGDGNWRHNLPHWPQITWPLVPFFLIGLFYSLAQIFRPKNFRRKNFAALSYFWTIIVWWGAMLLPSIMTNEGLPHALRNIGAIPPALIFTGLGFHIFIESVRKKIKAKKLAAGFCGLALVFIAGVGWLEYHRYFIVWGQNPETRGAFTQRFVDEGKYLNSLPPAAEKYVIVNEGGVPVPYPDGLPMPAQTVMFISHQTPNITYLKENETDLIQKQQQIVVLPMKEETALFDYLETRFPEGTVETITDFTVFKIGF